VNSTIQNAKGNFVKWRLYNCRVSCAAWFRVALELAASHRDWMRGAARISDTDCGEVERSVCSGPQ
jgi:hypothetical protein